MPNIDRNIYDNMRRILSAAGQLEQVTESFCSHSRNRIKLILSSIDSKDMKAISETSHALKGSCAMFGAKLCAEICQQLENASSEKISEPDYELLRQLTDDLAVELNDVIKFIQCQLDTKGQDCCP